LLHVLTVVDVEVRRLRRRQVVGLLAAKRRQGTFFAINTDYARFPVRSRTLPATLAQTIELASVKTRLSRLSRTRRRQLINWGYGACDAGLRSYVNRDLAEPPGFPYPAEGLPRSRTT
jgi:NTE family protein